jgi:hypothetical protein
MQQQASLIHQAIWWRGDGQPAFNWNGSAAGYGKGRADHRASRHDLGRSSPPVIACNKREALRKGAKATRQSNFPLCRAMDCFASLAMTVWRASGVSTTTPLP